MKTENKGRAPISLMSCWVVVWFFGTNSALAGMPSYDLSDMAKLRFQDISFFIALFLACGGMLWFLWNYVATGIPGLPRLEFRRALGLMLILSLGMLLVLSMISGARELLTPGAWRKQGSTYQVNDSASEPLRRQAMELLRSALMTYARQHGDVFPPHDYAPEIPEHLWRAPDAGGTRFIYVGGKLTNEPPKLLACEPSHFRNPRFVLMTDGKIQQLDTARVHEALAKPTP